MQALASDVKAKPDKKVCFQEARQSFLKPTIFETLSQALTHYTLKSVFFSTMDSINFRTVMSDNTGSISPTDIYLKEKYIQLSALTSLHKQNMETTPSFPQFWWTFPSCKVYVCSREIKRKRAKIYLHISTIPHQLWLSWSTQLVADVNKAHVHITDY